MDKFSLVLFTIWMVLAVASFVCNFFIPVTFIRVLGWVFGGFNLLIISSWVTAYFKEKAAMKKLNNETKVEEE